MNEIATLSLKLDHEHGVTREDFELACIREFSHSGQHLGADVSRAERRERIRASIFRENKAHRRWHDSQWNYAEVYAQAYRQPLEKRDSQSASRAGGRSCAIDEIAYDEAGLDADDI